MLNAAVDLLLQPILDFYGILSVIYDMKRSF